MRDSRLTQILALLDDARCLVADLIDELPPGNHRKALSFARQNINLAIRFLNPLSPKDAAA